MFGTTRAKATTSSRIRNSVFGKIISMAAAFSMASWPVMANPQGGTVVGGSATISQSPGSTIINQTSSHAIINWNDFSINAGELTSFQTGGASSATLNRVTGGNLSSILGALQSNGQVYLINPNGILIGASGRINTQGFLASTLDTDNGAFMSGGDLMFKGNSTASVVNLGVINGGAGDVFMFAQRVENHGSISAGGHVGLAAGSEILLKGADSGKGRVLVRAGTGSVSNSGSIKAAVAELRAAGGNHYALAINNTGVIRATGVRRSGGRVYLTAKRGRIRSRGRIIAKRSRGRGGKVIIKSATQGAVDISGEINVAGSTGKGGLIVVEADEINIASTAKLDASGATGGGEIYVGGGERGATVIQTSYSEDGDLGAGEEITVAKAKTVKVEEGASLLADSLEAGNGGKIVLWSDGTTTSAATLSAQAKGSSGDGGFIEVSGKEHLNFSGSADLRAANGNFGTLLLDPGTVNIRSGGVANIGLDTFDDSFIVAQLGLGNLTIATVAASNANGVPEDINIGEGVRILWDSETTLRMEAGNDIIANEDVLIQHSGDGDVDTGGGVVLLAGNDIKIGAAARTDTNGNGYNGVAIGSEHGTNLFVAGDSTFDGTPDKTGSVLLTGGDLDGSFAHLGYITDGTRSDTDRANGNITVLAGKDVILLAGGEDADAAPGVVGGAFVQIGHGGANWVDVANLQTINSVADIIGDITVTAGVVEAVDVNDAGDVKLDAAAGAGDTDYAQIGHGSFLANAGTNNALSQGNVSGNITVSTGDFVGSDILLNTGFTSQNPGDGVDNTHLAQIGSGGHLFYTGASLNGTEAAHGNIQGNIVLDAKDKVVLGTSAAADTLEDRFVILSQVGHGGHISMVYNGALVGLNGGDNSLDATHGSINNFDTGLTGGQNGFGTNISVTAAQIQLLAEEATKNSGGVTGLVVDNLQRSQIGHGQNTVASRSNGGFGDVVSVDGTATISGVDAAINGLTLAQLSAGVLDGSIDLNAVLNNDGDATTEDPGERAALQAIIDAATTTAAGNAPTPAVASGGFLNISVTEGNISGDITVTDDDVRLPGISLSSTITAGLVAINNDVMITRIGHGSQSYLNSQDGADGAVTGANGIGGNGFHGGDILVSQASILGGNISVTTPGVEGDDQDISVVTSITAGLAAVEDNTAVAQIGHGGDIFAHTGNGGAGAQGTVGVVVGADNRSGVSGASARAGDITINKGSIWNSFDVNGNVASTVAINVTSSNRLLIDSDTAAALASADRNNSESQIGFGHKIRLATGNGGTAANAASGGRGGDVTINQTDLANSAEGLRGLITVNATNTATAEFALDITADDTAALAATNNNTDRSQLGHGDVIEIVTGNGGAGGEANANDPTHLPVDAAGNLVQPESYGGRGGNITVALGDMYIESDVIANVSGAARINSTATNALSPSTRNIVESFMGHGQYIQTHAGDGAVGGEADFLANATATQSGSEYAAQGAVGGNGGDINITFGDITDRQGAAGAYTHDGEADVQIVITNDNTTPISLTVLAETVHALGESVGNDVFAGLGHHNRIYAEGGEGADGGSTRTEFDNFIQPESTGGRGGDVVIASGNIRGDVIADMPRQLLVESKFGHGTFTKVIATVGNTTDVVGVTQNGGNAGRLREDGLSGCTGACGDGGIDDANQGNPTITTITLVDGNDDDEFDLTGVNDANSTANEDGIDTNGDGVAETFASIAAQVGSDPTAGGGDADAVIFHDEEGDPQYILDAGGNLVLNDTNNNMAFAANANNQTRFGRDVAVYEADLGTNNDLARFIDLDQDGDVDLVDFDGDGRIDIVDVDKNGIYDQIDGRSVYGDVALAGGFNIMDYTTVTGLAPETANHVEGGWTLSDRNAGLVDEGGPFTRGGDFSTANGGRGGDAYTSVGQTIGDIEIDTGSDNDAAGNVDSLIVRSTQTDLIVATGGPRDVGIARVGHGSFQFSDTAGSYSDRNAGRVETQRLVGNDEIAIQGHETADGGNANYFAINASGGRGGDATAIQGINGSHLSGDIYINVTDDEQPLDLQVGRANASDARRITVEATATTDAGTGPCHCHCGQIGHGAQGAASAGEWTGLHGPLINAGDGNVGGNGASLGILAGDSDTSQTEIANGGRGGDGVLTQNAINGNIFVQTGGDDLSGNDASLQILATKGTIVPSGPNDIVIAQVGHGRFGQASGGDGGIGYDGQWKANGGRGGDATITQNRITSNISIDLVDTADGYYGNGMLIESQVQESGQHIVRAQTGHGDLAFAEGGEGANASDADSGKSHVVEQLNQQADGGRGGDALINQSGYTGNLTLDIGSNLTSPDANGLEIISHVDTVLVGTNNHVLANIGHGGYGEAITHGGGDGGNQDTNIPTITSGLDPNLRDGIDDANRIQLGTDRNGGRGGHATSNINVGGTTGDIFVGVHDNLDPNIGGPAAGGDGILIEARTGQGDNFTRAIDTTTASIGHHGFNRADATDATGGSGIIGVLASLPSTADGGDGGDATSAIGYISGDITVTNDLVEDGTLNNNGDLADTNILINTIDQLPSDGSKHRADARIGHMVSGEALAGIGGNSSQDDNGPPTNPATISAQGGNGGDAVSTQNQLYGNIIVTAENSVEVLATDGTSSNETLVSAIGHRMENEVVAGKGGEGSTAVVGGQNLYFIYEALREYEANGRNLSALSAFERKLISPFITDATTGADHVGYFNDKYMGHFLDRLLRLAQTTGGGGNSGANDRDNDFVGETDFSIPTLTAEEEETLLFIMAATGDGGHATSTQGSTLTINGIAETRSVNGNINVNALARNLTDTARGIKVIATDGGTSDAFEIAHIGHQAELLQARGGDAEDIKAFDDALGGDGGNVDVTQYAYDGKITLDSEHKINIEALDGTVNGARQRAWVGHRLAIGTDRPHSAYRETFIVRAGDGGSGTVSTDDSRNGNGGNVRIRQFGSVTNDTDTNIDILIDASNTTDAQDPNLHVSIRINAESVGSSSQEAETHIGHDMLIVSVKAGDAGQFDSLDGPEGLDIGIREGNGGDIRITQGDIGADIDITGRDSVDIDALTNLGPNDAHVIIGHERTIGEIADTHNDAEDRDGTIVAGWGGDSIIEDYNDTSTIDSWNGTGTITGNTTDVEDADAGVIYITHGTLGGSQATGSDSQVITITSLFEDVTLDTNSGTAGKARIEVGLSQHVHAQTLEASLEIGTPTPRTAGDGGDIRITRGEITGDILLQALDRDNGNPGPNGVGPNGDDQAVWIHSKTGSGGESEILIGHETEFGDGDTQNGNDADGFGNPLVDNAGTAISTSTGTSGASDQSSGFGEDRFADLDSSLGTFVGLDPAGTEGGSLNVAGEATLRDANQAVQDLRNTVAVLEMANQNADRYNAASQTDLATALTNAQGALAAAEAAFAALTAGTTTEAQAVTTVQAAAASGQTALTNAHDTVIAADIGAAGQIADHADAGDILYTANDALSGGTITNEGSVSGDIQLISGRDTNGSGSADTFNTGYVNVTSLTGSGGNAESEIGHRRSMHNITGQGGGDFNGGPEEGGVAGDGGNIQIGDVIDNNLGDVAQRDGVTGNRTSGNVDLTADEVIVRATTGSGGTAETHLLHDVEITNFADESDLESAMGNGGSINSAQTVGGNLTINANHLSSAEDANDSKIGSDSGGGGKARLHLGHEVDVNNDSLSDKTIGGTGGDEANRAGEIITAQTTSGDVTINLDLDGNGNPNDITIESTGIADGHTRLGHETNADTFSGDPTDDGADVVAVQTTSGNIAITNVEDVLIESTSVGDNDVYLGHDAENIAQSGDVNGPQDEFGGFVDADQIVSGAITIANGDNGVRSYTQRIVAPSGGEVHVGHEGTLTALSGDDGDDASRGAGEALRRSLDVDADQVISAALNIWAGEILLDSGGSDRVQFGHEAFITVDTDGGARTAGLDEASVHSRSFINPVDANGGGEDITIIASTSNIPVDDDTAIVMADADVQGDLKLDDSAGAGEVQIGHRSTSEVSHGAPQPTGLFDTLHAIGGIQTADGSPEITDTAGSTINITTERDLEVLDSNGGIAQIGHYITEQGPLSGPGAVQAGSLVRQSIGSDIVIGDAVGGTGGVGNNLVMISSGGRSEIGHRSPGSNEWQVTGGNVITPQIIDGDITILVGTDDGGVINGAAPGNTDAGGDDDALLDGTGGGTVRIGHNHASDDEGSANNEVQVSAGNVYLEVDSDLHVLTANVGHEHYDHDDLAVDANNAVAGLGAIRNRIRGNTTIGAGQNSPTQDSTLLADVMKFDTANVNSGYGGQADRDVDGELRFFIPAQENLTIASAVFNDSGSSGDAPTDRTADSSNVFSGTGGEDHEHVFTQISRTADYTDEFIGDGNFTFYFETPPPTGVDIDFAHPIREYLHDSLGGGLDYSTSDMYVGRTLQMPTYSGFAGYSASGPSSGRAGSGGGVIGGQGRVIQGSIAARAGYEPNEICGGYGSDGLDCHEYDDDNFTVIEGYRGLVQGSAQSAPVGSGSDDGSFVTGALPAAPAAQTIMVTQQVPSGPAPVQTADSTPLVTVQPSAPSTNSGQQVIVGQSYPHLVPTKVSARGWMPRAMAQMGGGVAIK